MVILCRNCSYPHFGLPPETALMHRNISEYAVTLMDQGNVSAQSKSRQSEATVAHETFRQFESSIVAMEQIDDAGLCRRNPCSFNSVDACGRLAGLASTVN